jgi:hypothetical protein
MPSPFVWILAGIIIIFTILMIIAYMTPWYGVSTSTSCTPDGNYATDQIKGSDCCSQNGATAAYAGSLLVCNPARSTSVTPSTSYTNRFWKPIPDWAR